MRTGGRAGPAQLGGRGGRESDSGGTHFGVRDRPLLVSLLNNLKTPKKVAGRACGLPWKPLELVGATENLEKDAWSASWWGQTWRGGWSSVLPVSPPAAEVGHGWRWLQGPWTRPHPTPASEPPEG